MMEFLKNYANSFWKFEKYAAEVLSIVTAWAITLGLALGIIVVIWALGACIAERIIEHKKYGRR